MNYNMKKYIKNSILRGGLSILALALLSSCSDWTDVESIELKKADIAEQNPELYAEYLRNLCEYKKSEHTLVYTWFDNSEKAPYSRAHHITDLPDSIDIVSLMYPDNLATWELEDMESVRENKATKVIYSIDFESIKKAYNEKLKLATEEEPISEDFIGFLTDSLEYSLSLADKYRYDGICIGYAGKSRLHMRPNELKEYTENETAFIQIINDWHTRNPEKMITYEGKPQNLIDSSLLDDCVSILLSGKKATNENEFSYILSLAMVENIPDDRLGMIVMAVSLNDPNKEVGYFKNGSLAVQGLMNWAPATHNGTKVAAVGLYNASTDYYTVEGNYYYMKQLISSVNPAIK